MQNNTASLEIVGALALFLLAKTGNVCGKFEGRITAAEQREFFGCVPFGKCLVQINGNPETVIVSRKVCFGTDFEMIKRNWLELEQMIHRGESPASLGRAQSLRA